MEKSSVASQTEVSLQRRAGSAKRTRQGAEKLWLLEPQQVERSQEKHGTPYHAPLTYVGSDPAWCICTGLKWFARSGYPAGIFCWMLCLKHSLHPCQVSWTWPCLLTETEQGLMNSCGKGTWNVLAAAHTGIETWPNAWGISDRRSEMSRELSLISMRVNRQTTAVGKNNTLLLQSGLMEERHPATLHTDFIFFNAVVVLPSIHASVWFCAFAGTSPRSAWAALVEPFGT